MSVSIIIHEGKAIIFLDYTKCSTKEEMIETVRSGAALFQAQPGLVCSLSDFTGAYGSTEFLEESKKLSDRIMRAKTDKAAAIGVTGIKKILLSAFNTFSANKLKAFKTKEEALAYLIS